MQYYQRYCQLYQTLKTIQLGCPVSSKIRWRDKTTTVSFLVECWDWELFKDKCLIFPVAARPARREYSVASLGNPNHLVYDLYLFTSDLWYRNDKSKNFQNQILNWLLGQKVFSHKLTLDLWLVQSTHTVVGMLNVSPIRTKFLVCLEDSDQSWWSVLLEWQPRHWLIQSIQRDVFLIWKQIGLRDNRNGVLACFRYF